MSAVLKQKKLGEECNGAEDPGAAKKEPNSLYLRTKRRLLKFHEAPHYLRDNEFLVRGYRPLLSFKECVESIYAYRSNEFFNIWSHLIGTFLFSGVLVYMQLFFDWPHDAPEHRIIFSVFLASAAVCCFLSTIYHTFGCMSERIYRTLLKCDYIGISTLISGSISILVYYLFSCNLYWRNMYLSGIGLLMFAGIGFSSWDTFYSVHFRVGRAALFVLMGASGMVPACHFMFVVGADDMHNFGIALPFVIMMATYLAGAIVFASRVPERWKPGRFDMCMHSHTYMHISVIVAASFHLLGSARLYNYLHNLDDFSCSKNFWLEPDMLVKL
eukprot:ANDGO_03613.mRNA.1 Adiponectin receptor protein